eukprot:2558845-Pleurochrysis_carterae.AAC.1
MPFWVRKAPDLEITAAEPSGDVVEAVVTVTSMMFCYGGATSRAARQRGSTNRLKESKNKCPSVLRKFKELSRKSAMQVGANGVELVAEKIAEEGVPLGRNTASSSLILAGTGGDFEKAGASVYGSDHWQTYLPNWAM